MLCDRRSKCDYRAVVACPAQALESAAVSFICHADRAVERWVHVPVTRVKSVKHIANEIIPMICVERRGVRAAVHLIPFAEDGLRQVRIYRQRVRREKELRRLAMMVD